MTPVMWETVFAVISGICWMIVYEECIRIGLTKKTYCMPLFALGLNLAWESIYSLMGLAAHNYNAQTIVNTIWFLMDAVILYTYLCYGWRENGGRRDTKFYAWTALVIVSSYILQIAFVMEFGALQAMRYSAYLQNTLMSVLFISMLQKRRSSEGQSMLLAIAKWLGTVAPLGNLMFELQPLILLTGILCSVFDVLYIILLGKQIRSERLTQGA